jgi:hypothetical protein
MKIIGYDTVVYRFLKVRAGENVKFNRKIDRTLSRIAFISGKNSAISRRYESEFE